MCIPREYWDMTIDHVPEAIRDNISNYLNNFDVAADKGAGLLLSGPMGVGKTTAAAVVAMRVRSRARTALFSRILELRNMLRTREMFDADILMSERIREVDILVLDDLRRTDVEEKFFPSAEIEQLIRFRSSWCRPTVVTTRLDVQGEFKVLEPFLSTLIPLQVTGENLYSEREEEMRRLVQG